MDKTFKYFAISLLIIGGLLLGACGQAAPDTIKIGVNAPMTGDIPKVGEGTKFAAEMWRDAINGAGGLDIGGTKYQVELVIEDNESKAESAVATNTKMITQDEVLIIIGPQASKQAVPAGQVANDNRTPMISPWSTNPNTTLDRPWVFRACFLDDFQGPAVANFVTAEFGFTKAAVLYDIASDYPKGLAEFFKSAWEGINGAGSVVAYESFTTKDADFSAQLTKIRDSGAEFLFTPQYYNEVALIAQQAHQLGFNAPIMGSDSWGSAELVPLCGDDCYGAFFTTHYAAAGAVGATKEFIDNYNAKHGYIPDDVAALTWDAFNLAKQAMEDCGSITGDLAADRQCVRDALAQVTEFPGITGTMTYKGTGDPSKCAVIVKISDTGDFNFYQQSCP
ncbi:MAG: ABC transporter substrate-binding protein [Anaerolineales bacterium]